MYVSSNFDGNFYRIRAKDDAVRAGLVYYFNYSESETPGTKNSE
jgi:hypothetical protein